MPGIYEAYAPIYRRIEQGAWSARVARWTLDWLSERGTAEGRVTDWGCGDGAAALVFNQAGWRVTGIDRSPAMIELARKRADSSSEQINWREGDLRDPPEVAPGDLATAFYDTLNYLITPGELQAGWRTLAHAVLPGGYVVADVNTPHEYATAWRDQHVIIADTDDLVVINHLRYNATTRLARGRVIWFARVGESDEWQRGSELHVQRAHTDAEMTAAIEAAGLTLIERRSPQDALPLDTATRLIYIARKE